MANKISIVSNLADFGKMFPVLVEKEKDSARLSALRRYFFRGGVINISSISKEGDWPEIVYPTQLRLKKLLGDVIVLKKNWLGKKAGWERQLNKAKMQDVTDEIMKFADPLFWKHLVKYYSNVDYKSDADAVKLPVRLVAEKRWRPMINMFVNDLDYRKQLTETVQKSVVYANDKRLAKYAEQLKSFRLEQSNRELGNVAKQFKEIDADIEMYKELLKWVK